jgi:hypothetical protein
MLLDSVKREAYLTPVGRFITRQRLLGTLKNRLRVQHLLTKYPEILEEKLAPPIVITGLQRTGTTLLHRLLASDPRNRALLSWEAINPAPFIGNGSDFLRDLPHDPRIKVAKTSERVLSFLAPDFFAIHPVEAEAPEEDVLLLDYTFLSTVPEATLRVPAYAAWLEEQNQRPAYEYMTKLLKLLQWQRSAERWVLKSPHHLENLEVLFQVFSGARVIQTHRDPCTTTASFCSMLAHGRGVFADRVDPGEVARHWMRKLDRMIRRSMEARAKISPDRFLDVSYYDLVSNPLGQMARIYDWMRIPLPEKVLQMMGRTLEVQVQHRYGIHSYRLEDFGLDRETIKRQFQDYVVRFDIPVEGDAQ